MRVHPPRERVVPPQVHELDPVGLAGRPSDAKRE